MAEATVSVKVTPGELRLITTALNNLSRDRSATNADRLKAQKLWDTLSK